MVMVNRADVATLMRGLRLGATVPARRGARSGRLGDRVTRRRVRRYVGQRADRYERAGRHPPVHPRQASNSDVARNLCPVASHP